jgi:hypothetical protein
MRSAAARAVRSLVLVLPASCVVPSPITSSRLPAFPPLAAAAAAMSHQAAKGKQGGGGRDRKEGSAHWSGHIQVREIREKRAR